MKTKKPVVLCILDGWGFRAEKKANAIELGHTPNWHRMLKEYPHGLLEASGLAVGLPEGQMGNSEVGHQNIGAGRVVMQLLGQIERAVRDDSLGRNPALEKFASRLAKTGGTCHLWGLLSDGGVHSHISHIKALVKALGRAGIPIALHIVTDGRDVGPKSALGFVRDIERLLDETPGAYVATISGRYYAMDRNKTWDRVRLAYDAMVSGAGPRFADAAAAVGDSYAKGVTDEFIVPAAHEKYGGMGGADGVLFANFRADRVRELAGALVLPGFEGFPRPDRARPAAALGIAEYGEELNGHIPAMFPPQKLPHIFGEVISGAGLSQLRIAETEKYAHVTFFFNGGEEKKFPGEERILIPSPAVATYDLKPEMSAYEITKALGRAVSGQSFDVIVANYANGDMVGHTGMLAAAEKAAAAVDDCIGRLERLVLDHGGAMLITADHGNVELMEDERGNPVTSHTTNPVECVAIGTGARSLRRGRLADIAPTLLKILGLGQPAEMTGEALF